ncbi:MAG: hypothetical protein U0841_28680 [Chloroflexia bacterium]
MANKFKISLKLTGFELQIEGSRDDVPLMAQAVGQQLTGMLMPAADFIEGEVVEPKVPALAATIEPAVKPSRKRPARSRTRTLTSAKPNPAPGNESIDWTHNPEKWGNPKQQWNPTQKAMWLLYVVSKEANTSELTSRSIANTFNKHFRESGTILVQNVARDLGRRKKNSTPPELGNDTTKEPSTWFLTTAGIQEAEKLVAEALGRTAGSGGA